MRNIGLYVRLCWLFFLALFVPTAIIEPKIQALQAAMNPPPPPADPVPTEGETPT